MVPFLHLKVAMSDAVAYTPKMNLLTPQDTQCSVLRGKLLKGPHLEKQGREVTDSSPWSQSSRPHNCVDTDIKCSIFGFTFLALE